MIYVPSVCKIDSTFSMPEVQAEDVIDQPNFKYADFEEAYLRSCPYVKTIMDEMRLHIAGKHRYTLIDIKHQEIKKDKLPAYGFWHTDVTLDINHSARPEKHTIFISGADCQTQFVNDKIILLFNHLDLKKWTPDYEEMVQYGINLKKATPLDIKEGMLYAYGRDLHRATPAKKDGTRILIRATETDIVKPLKKRF